MTDPESRYSMIEKRNEELIRVLVAAAAVHTQVAGIANEEDPEKVTLRIVEITSHILDQVEAIDKAFQIQKQIPATKPTSK